MHEVNKLRAERLDQLLGSVSIFVGLRINIRLFRIQRVGIAVQKVFELGHVHTLVQKVSDI